MLGQKVRPGSIPDLQIDLPHSPLAPSLARQALDTLSGPIDAECMDDLRLLVSEVVTNSVRHAPPGAKGLIQLTIMTTQESVRAEIRDSGPGFTFVPRSRRFNIDQVSGWGLDIVRRVAESWGISNEGGVCVWFEIRNQQAH